MTPASLAILMTSFAEGRGAGGAAVAGRSTVSVIQQLPQRGEIALVEHRRRPGVGERADGAIWVPVR